MKTDFLSLNNLSAQQLRELLHQAAVLKAERTPRLTLRQRTLLLMFEKPSTRTRLSFAAAMTQLGGASLFVSAEDMQLSRGEPLEDVARVAGSMVDAVALRTDSHEKIERFAQHCEAPVINALSDLLHPCQTLADLLTIEETFGSLDVTVAWVGDGNNSLNSWLEASALLGFELHYSCPPGYGPDTALAKAPLARAVSNPTEAVQGAQVVSTDVWISMNQDEEKDRRLKDFTDWQVDTKLMDSAREDAILLHCLPAHRGQEVTAEVLNSPRCRIWQQAENRLHAQKALLELLLAG